MGKKSGKKSIAEELLQEERDLFISGPVITFKWNLQKGWDLEYVSPNISQFGYESEEFTSGKTHFSQVIHPDDREKTASEVDEFVKSDREILEQDFRIITKDNRVIWVYDRMKVKRDENQNIISYYGYLIDITERKQTEQEIEREKAYLEKLFEHSPDCIVLVNKNSEILKVNKNFTKLFGYKVSEVKGKNLDKLICNSDTIIEASKLTSKAEKGERVFIETIRYNKQGKPIHVSILGVPIFFRDRELEVYAIYRDITKRKMAEKKLKQTNIELKQLKEHLEEKVKNAVRENREKDQMIMVQSRQAAMGEMISNIAHQWRQPLNGLGLIIQDFEEAYEFGEMNKEYLEKQVQKGMDLIKYLSETIDDFRNFFKPSKEENKFSVKKAIEKTITLVENSFEHNNIKIDFTVEQDVWVTGQPNQFSQVIINILNNSKDAFKNSKSKSQLVKIHLSKEGKKAKLIIKDNAGGIPNKIIDKIFESYFTTKEGNEGTGLGLFISKTIIEKNMKGKISVRNHKDGAEFIIFI